MNQLGEWQEVRGGSGKKVDRMYFKVGSSLHISRLGPKEFVIRTYQGHVVEAHETLLNAAKAYNDIEYGPTRGIDEFLADP